MVKHESRLVALAAACLPGAILAQEPLTPKTFEEHRYERAKVSGALVVGAMYGLDVIAAGTPMIEAVLPADRPADTACLRLTSRDGTYESISTYALPSGSGERRQIFGHPTRYADLLGSIPTVARMNFGECDRGEPILPVNWSGADATQEVTFYINTAGADTVLALETDAGEVVVRCDQIDAANGIKYTASCPLDASLLPASGPVTLYFDVTRNRSVETYEVEVAVAAR